MATAAQLTKQIGGFIATPRQQRRTNPAIRRAEIVAAQVAALQAAIEDIRRKARETPAWAHGYHSAITSLEAQIQLVSAPY